MEEVAAAASFFIFYGLGNYAKPVAVGMHAFLWCQIGVGVRVRVAVSTYMF